MATRKGRKTPERKPDPKAKARFLAAYEKAAFHVSNACEAAGVGRRTYYTWREKDPDFAQAVEELKSARIDRLETTIMDRAENGWLEPVFHEGEVCGEKLRFDNTLSWRMLQAHKRERYANRNNKPSDAATIELLPMETLADARANLSRIASAMADGSLPLDVGAQLTASVNSFREAVVADEVAEDVAAIKEHLGLVDDAR